MSPSEVQRDRKYQRVVVRYGKQNEEVQNMSNWILRKKKKLENEREGILKREQLRVFQKLEKHAPTKP